MADLPWILAWGSVSILACIVAHEASKLDLAWRAVAWVVSREPVATWLLARALRTPYSPIVKNGDTYMTRFWLFNPYEEDGTYRARHAWCPVSVRIHMILRPDADRDLHDHPWNARTIILAGGYAEQRDDGALYVRRRGDTSALRFGDFHRITNVAKPRGAMTLFITGRYRGTWGFLVAGRKVPYREYLNL